MVKLVVSKSTINFQTYSYYRALRDVVNSGLGKIDVLVLFYTGEDEKDLVSYLASIRDRVDRVFYICNKDMSSYAVRVMVTGMGGVYCEDDDIYTLSITDLDSLVEEYGTVNALVPYNPKGSSLITGFVDTCLISLQQGGKDSKEVFTKGYLEAVKNACDGLIAECRSKDLENSYLSKAAYGVLAWAYDVMGEMEVELGNAKESFNKIQQTLEEGFLRRRQDTPTVFLYPQFTYKGYSRVLRIKELGSFNYLTSFILGFRVYLMNKMHLRPKIIFIYPVGSIWRDIYKYTWFNSEDKGSIEEGDSIVFTNTPTYELINILLSDKYFDCFIIVDRTTLSNEHIVKKGLEKTIYAVGGEGVIDTFNLNKADCIMSGTRSGDNFLCNVGEIKNYPKDENQRMGVYVQEMNNQYSSLASRLGEIK